MYAVSAVIYIYCLVFEREDRVKYGMNTAAIGLLLHSVSLAIRWIEAGHGPYVAMYEVLSSYVWVSVAVFLIVHQRYERIRIAGAIVMPVAFLIMGVGSTYSRDITLMPASLRSFWLAAHVGFAKLAFGSVLVAVGIAVLYILKERAKEHEGEPEEEYEEGSLLSRLPPLDAMDDLMYRFIATGFLFLTVMIGAGAIWANQTWGRYWGWDPIETWSLITWFMYGIILHIRMNAGWRGRRIAMLIILSIFVLAFSAFGVGYVYSGLHTGYLTS